MAAEKSQPRNVIVYSGEPARPIYELSGNEIVFPIVLEQGGVEVMAYFHMVAQYMAAEVKAFLGEMMISWRTSEIDEREIELGNESGCRKFIDKHFIRVSGVEGDPSIELMRSWLDANLNVKSKIWNDGYSRLVADTDSNLERKLTLFIGEHDNEIKIRRPIYSPEMDRIETLLMTHRLKQDTEEDRIRYRRSSRLVDKGRRQIPRFNWDVVEQIYDKLILSIDGMMLDGNPCLENNKEQWVHRIPITDKIFVAGRIFRLSAVKNV